MLHAAAGRLHAHGFHVSQAYLSPSHDGYVQPKAAASGTIGLSAAFRLCAAQRAVEADPLVSVAAWEAAQPGERPDFPEVCEALRGRLGGGRRLFYVCGADHAARCGLGGGMGEVGVVVVPRGAAGEGGLRRLARSRRGGGFLIDVGPRGAGGARL